MIVFVAGSSHTGKTKLAQQLLERYHVPYLSIDHLKMGLIRSGQTALTPVDDDLLTDYLWPIVREMVKTAIENGQSLIIEGCYIPHSWRSDFDEDYLKHIHCCWLIMTKAYIETHLDQIRVHANDAEQRLYDDLDPEELIRDNQRNLSLCSKFGNDFVLIDKEYPHWEELYDHPII